MIASEETTIADFSIAASTWCCSTVEPALDSTRQLQDEGVKARFKLIKAKSARSASVLDAFVCDGVELQVYIANKVQGKAKLHACLPINGYQAAAMHPAVSHLVCGLEGQGAKLQDTVMSACMQSLCLRSHAIEAGREGGREGGRKSEKSCQQQDARNRVSYR